jgi:hypothetical protein
MSDSVLATIKAAATNAQAGILAGMLDGPAGSVGLAALGRVLLGDDNAGTADIAAVVQQGGADLTLQLQQAEQQCLTRLQQADPAWLAAFPIGNTMTPQNLDNTLDARKRQIALHDDTNRWLAYGVSIAFFALIVVLITVSPTHWGDGSMKDLLFTLLGVVATGWANIIGYYFGSSAGSQQKSMAINAALSQSISQSGP